MKKTFETIFLDITGFCNAKCPYCLSGRYSTRNSGFISPQMFDRTLNVLQSNDAVAKNAVIGLYNWGEPFLHPQINDLTEIINNYKFSYSFSTNASKVPKIDSTFVKGLDHIIFSMPGFSKDSYARIHGLNFDTIITNIRSIVRECRVQGFNGEFKLYFHVYQFNLGELRKCEDFAGSLNIVFKPYYAILNNWWHIISWLDNSLPYDILKQVSQDLFCYDIERIIAEAPEKYDCPQYDILVVDENANVMNCCQVPKDGEFVRGNLLTDDFSMILKSRLNNDICKTCIESGLAYYFHNSLEFPRMYKKSLRQDFLFLKHTFLKGIHQPGLVLRNVFKRFHA